MSLDLDSKSLSCLGYMALLTECIALFFVLYKHRTPDGVAQVGVILQRFGRGN
jgi:hypothetical protein